MQKNILITGMSGTGKSTIADSLVKMGHQAIDMDEYENLCNMYYKDSGKLVEIEYDNHDLNWVKRVEWLCNMESLKEILYKSPTVDFYCGSADNIDEILPFFDSVILLQTDEDTFRTRLTNRTNNNWGQTKEVQDWLLHQKEDYEEHLLRNGAISINTTQPIQNIIEEILTAVGYS